MKVKSEKKYAGPSKKMMQALEEEGLYVSWPKTGNVEDNESLAIDASFTTGPDWEKCLLIDLRNMNELGSKNGCDRAIANQLQEAYDNFDLDEEVKLGLEGSESERKARGVPDVVRLVEDKQEQERRLKRFADVAYAVAYDKPMPSEDGEDDGEAVGISRETAQNIVALIIYAMDKGAGKKVCKPLISELTRKLEG